MKNSSNGHNGVIYEFDGFRVDEARKCVWHVNELVSLTPKAFDTLLVLLKNPGEVVAKDVLLEEVWPGTFVEESTLSQNILTLRKTLRSFEKDTQFITTVPRRGYRFVAPVTRRNGSNGSNGVAVAVTDPSPVKIESPAHITQIAGPTVLRSILTWIAVGSLLAITVVAILLVMSGSGPMADTKFRDLRSRTLLSDGSVRAAAISPDGNYLSLIERRDNVERLLVRQVDESNPVEIATEAEGRIVSATFSPDSRYVLYTLTRQMGGGRIGELFRVPILGGVRTPIVSDIDSPVSVSSSGRLAFVRRRQNEGDTQLLIAESDGSAERVIASRNEEEAFVNASISPDSSQIIAAVRAKQSLDRPMELVLVDTASGQQRTLTAERWLWIGQSVWLADGSGVAVVAYGPTSANLTDEVWVVPIRGGKARLLESGINGVFGISLTADGRSIVAVKSDKITSFVISPIDDLGRENAIVTRASDQSLLPLGVDWAADGRILFATTDNNNADIYSIAPDGSGRRRLTAGDYAELQPRLAPDGGYLYFLSNRTGQMNVWRSRANGDDPQQLTRGSDVFSLTLSPDGRYVYYTSRADSVFSHHLWRANADGSDAVRLTNRHTLQPRLSPDGKTVLCFYSAAERTPPVLTALNAENGEVIRQFTERNQDITHVWHPNGRDILVLTRVRGGTALARVSIETGGSTIIREWQNESVYRMTVSPDGKQLFLEKGVAVNNVVLLVDGN